ncbi:MAG: thioredoxin family protein [Isosphaeraceae bacterium]|nr:thioredoxin family protein [Isosphaeraceae bacterium]
MDWSTLFAEALPYTAFLDRYATPEQRARWEAMHARIRLTEEQKTLLGSFRRQMPVFVLNGAWCGDCINQCPIFDHFARATPAIDLRFFDRDARPEVRDALMMNGGHRVPMVVFLSEDWQEVARYGDRTLSRYRQLAADQLGPACPTGLVPPGDDATARVIQEWLNEFERAQLVLRLSPRLRQRHGD